MDGDHCADGDITESPATDKKDNKDKKKIGIFLACLLVLTVIVVIIIAVTTTSGNEDSGTTTTTAPEKQCCCKDKTTSVAKSKVGYLLRKLFVKVL